MALAQILSRACVGVEAPLITVEVHLSGGLPCISIVGMPETAVREARDRVRSALQNTGFEFPVSRVTISLAPAELPKEGGGFDLPIALGILAASGQVPAKSVQQHEFLGELSLSGELRAVRGALPAALRAAQAGRRLVVPAANGAEAALAAPEQALCAAGLLDVAAWLHGHGELETARAAAPVGPSPPPDLSEVVGQPRARRALEVAAAGGHNLLLVGPPGTGKTMLARRLPGILPPLTEKEGIETAAIASVSTSGFDPAQWRRRPFRAPHHTSSAVALVGGGSQPKPGEISLAHHGILFLDELPEFNRHVLEVLREPLESGCILISRAARQARFPARFQLIAAMNPCPCGYAGAPGHHCHCSAEQIQRYRHRVSGPLLDRIDLQVEVPRPNRVVVLPTGGEGDDSERVRRRVEQARSAQQARQQCLNARLEVTELRRLCPLGSEPMGLLENAADRFGLSPRATHRIIKVARTIADLGEREDIGTGEMAEAIAYRQFDAAGPGREAGAGRAPETAASVTGIR